MGSGNSKKGEQKLTKKDLRYFFKEVKEHEKGINSMCITPNGSMIITVSEDNTARIFDVAREEFVSVLKGHDSYINHVVANDDYVFTASADQCIKKWRIDTGMCSKTLKGHVGAINRLVLFDNILFSSSYDRTARCWHIDTGECKAVFTGHKLGVYPLLYIPQGDDDFERDLSDLENNNDILVTGSVDNTARSWSLSTKETLITYKGHQGAVLSLAADSNGKYLFTGSTDNVIRSFNMHTGKIIRSFEGHQASVLQLQVTNYSLIDSVIFCKKGKIEK